MKSRRLALRPSQNFTGLQVHKHKALHVVFFSSFFFPSYSRHVKLTLEGDLMLVKASLPPPPPRP